MSFKDKLENGLLSTNAALDYLEDLESKVQDAIKEMTYARDYLEELKSDFEYVEQVIE